jgi:hypothetical protein
MSQSRQSAEETVKCAEHGTHPWASIPPTRLVTEEMLRSWLMSSRRVYVSWNIDTGMRHERLSSTTLGVDRAGTYSAILWRRYCSEPPMTIPELALGTGLARDGLIQALRFALIHIRDAFRAPHSSVPDELQPGTRLAVALYACATAPNTAASLATSAPQSV